LDVTEFVQWFKFRLECRLEELHAFRVKCENEKSGCLGHDINFLNNGSPNFDQLLQNLTIFGKCQIEAQKLAAGTGTSKTGTSTERESEETIIKMPKGKRGQQAGGRTTGRTNAGKIAGEGEREINTMNQRRSQRKRKRE